MQSIDENDFDDFPDPLSQTMKESYVQRPAKMASYPHSATPALPTDADADALHNISSITACQDLHRGLLPRGKSDPLFQVDTIKERATSKVAPITVENLEKHERCQSNVPLHADLTNYVNETSRSAFVRIPSSSRQGSVKDDIFRTANFEQVQNIPRLGTGIKSGHSVKRTVKAGSVQRSLEGVSKIVSDQARIARGLGRATNVVPPSIMENMQLLDTANYGVCLQR